MNMPAERDFQRNVSGIGRISRADAVYYAIVNALLLLLIIVVLYPLIYILSSSFSSPNAVISGKVWLYPVDISLAGYRAIFQYRDVFIGYRNTIFYTVFGTFINISLTMGAAYALARRGLPGKGFFTFLFTFTMIFSGGLIPNYLLMKGLGLLNTVWALLIPGAIGVTNLIIARTFIQSNVPEEVLEAARIDGCSDFRFFFTIVLPLSKAVLAVLTLYYAVGHWNSYFNAFIYLNNKQLYPLQLFLRDILVNSQISSEAAADEDLQQSALGIQELIKYALIVVSSVPILCIYPFIQKYFEKGVLIGSLKG